MEKKIVVFNLKDEEFAFDIMKVIEIIRVKEITVVPTAPPFITGVINLRGKIIPIIDLRKRFNMEDKEKDKTTRIIILEFYKNQFVGVTVDNVSQVLNIKDDNILPSPPAITGPGSMYIEKIVKIDERIIILLDIEKIFTSEEQAGLKEIAEKEIMNNNNMEVGKIENRIDS